MHYGLPTDDVKLRLVPYHQNGKGLTQDQLAEKSGVGVTHISHIETGKSVPSLEMIIKLVNAFECSADELLCVEVKKAVELRNN